MTKLPEVMLARSATVVESAPRLGGSTAVGGLAAKVAPEAPVRARIAVVIPAYRVTAHILDVIRGIGEEVERIYVIDDACPERTGAFVEEHCKDDRVRVIFNPVNLGVGGAVMEGYKAALEEELEIIVKLDGDGQMDPTLLPELVAPIVDGYADYAKGNRFYNLERISKMPKARIFGNALLSFLTKLSAGYWDIFDPTNGYTAIHWKVAQELPFEKISQRYFFESDMLFRLNTVRAVVVDVPMDARYGAESSGLSIRKILPGFAARHFANFVKRLFYNYYLRDMSVASIQLPFGILMTVLGVVYGGASWIGGIQRDVPSLPGTVTLSALLIIVGTQLILAFLGYDIASVPRNPIHKRLHMRGGGLK